MEIKATEFRRNLFQVLDKVMKGEPADITYRGAKLHLTAPAGGSKLARAVRRHSLLVAPASIVESDAELMTELNRKWKQDDNAL